MLGHSACFVSPVRTKRHTIFSSVGQVPRLSLNAHPTMNFRAKPSNLEFNLLAKLVILRIHLRVFEDGEIFPQVVRGFELDRGLGLLAFVA